MSATHKLPSPPSAAPSSAASLVHFAVALARNAVPVWGFLGRGWSPATTLVVYWFETLVGTLLTALLAAQICFHSTHWLSATDWARPELAATYSWIKAHSRPQDILASPLYVRDGYRAARPSLPLPDGTDAAAFRDAGALAHELLEIREVLGADARRRTIP